MEKIILKNEIDNPNLYKIGYIHIKMADNNTVTTNFDVVSNGDTEIYSTDGNIRQTDNTFAPSRVITGPVSLVFDKTNMSFNLQKNNLVSITVNNSVGMLLEDVVIGYSDTLTSIILSNVGLNGNLADLFGRCIAVTTFNFLDNNIDGSIEEFVAAQRKNGRITCESLVISNFNRSNKNNITFNGVRAVTTSGMVLSWTANTITLGEETIDA